ncbi:MAG: hypothetical protein HAW59_03125 [Betaproteobacteria bacterium]|nr:hypothetical protein [Betaproteobacteria bacterium]
MKTTKLILAAAVVSAAVFSQSALAYGAIWKYGGNYGLGKGVGAVVDYETQAEANRAAIADCEKKRPHWATRSKWGKCRIEHPLRRGECATYARHIIKAVKTVPNPDDPDGAPTITKEDHSSMLFSQRSYSPEFTPKHLKWRMTAGRESVPFYCRSSARWRDGQFVAQNSNPAYAEDPNISLEVDCARPTYIDVVCDTADHSNRSNNNEQGRDQFGNEIN